MDNLEESQGNYLIFNNKKYSYFAGNNYLGLAGHPLVKEAAIRSIGEYGVNFSASRQTTGTFPIHMELEKQLSLFKKKDNSAVYASGYMGNSIMLQLLRKEYSAVFMDESSHPSIVEAVPRDIKHVFRYDHTVISHLENLLRENKKFRPLIMTEGIFALTGEIAPLDQICSLAQKYKAIVIVDDAHSTGVLGKNGRGTPEYFHLDGAENLYQTETMSKAIGAYGGFISGSTEMIDTIRKRSTVYQASTALPPPIAAAGCASLKIMAEQPHLRTRLLETARVIRKGIAGLGYMTTPDITPIIPVMFHTSENAGSLSAFLEVNGILAPGIQYPVKTKLSIVRITASVNHTPDQTGMLLDLLKKWRNKNGTLAD